MRTSSTTSSMALALALLGALPACSAPKPEPEIASSAPLGTYAKSYPADLASAAKAFSDRRAEARKLIGEFPSYPGKLKDPDWAHVLEVIDRADDDGRGFAYVERARRVEAVQAFYDTEKDEINRKVGGNVAFVAKKKGCDPDVGSGVPSSLKDSIEKQLDKELADVSQSRQLVERYKGELGKENAAALEKMANDVSRASYLVRVQVVEDKLRITRMIGEAEQIKRTADQAVEAERAYQAGKKVTDAEKKASQARIEEMNKSKAMIDSAVTQASSVAQTMEDEIQKLQKEHADALAALRAKIQEKKK